MSDTETFTYYETRWQCRGCARFVAESAIHSRDYVDPGAYYGVSSETWCVCPRCGCTEDPACIQTRERTLSAVGDVRDGGVS